MNYFSAGVTRPAWTTPAQTWFCTHAMAAKVIVVLTPVPALSKCRYFIVATYNFHLDLWKWEIKCGQTNCAISGVNIFTVLKFNYFLLQVTSTGSTSTRRTRCGTAPAGGVWPSTARRTSSWWRSATRSSPGRGGASRPSTRTRWSQSVTMRRSPRSIFRTEHATFFNLHCCDRNRMQLCEEGKMLKIWEGFSHSICQISFSARLLPSSQL